MSIIGKLREKWTAKRKRKSLPSVGVTEMQGEQPIIQTPWGPVTESARYRAALNMREDPSKRLQVEQLLANQLFDGDLEKGKAESRARYPEAYRP